METAFDTLLKRLLTEDLSKSTILDLASQSKDKQLLVDDLLLASYGYLFNGMKEAAGGIRREGITYLDPVGSAKREPIPSYMLHYGTKDWKPIERIKEVAKIICDEYGLDWMEADSPTLQELETKRDGISKDLELVLKKLPGYIPGKIKPEDYYKWLQEITDRAETAALEAALAKGLSQEAAQALAADVVPLELEAESLAQSLAEITAEIEKARQQEARAAVEPEMAQEYPEQKHNHFEPNTKVNLEQHRKIYQCLVDAEYIEKKTPLSRWLYISGMDTASESASEKINWQKQKQELAYFIDAFWGKYNSNSLWMIAISCFQFKGKDMTDRDRDNLKNSLPKTKPENRAKPKQSIQELDSIINGTYKNSQ